MAASIGLRGRILVADDDGPLGRLFKAVLAGQGHEVDVVTDGEAARQRITTGRFDLVLVDLTMGPVGGLGLLEHTRTASPGTTVVIITGNATVESAVEALKKGAHDYLVKPVQNEQLVQMVRNTLRIKHLGRECRRTGEALKRERRRTASLQENLRASRTLAHITGSSGAMEPVRALLGEIVQTDSTVLILGESGTGKSLLARTIHEHSHRAVRPFIEINCAVYPEGLLMSELFGHEGGAFTGASKRKRGRFELAEGGTVFLDEVGDLPPATQVALLRFLQERRYERVGGEETLDSDVRVIAATNRDLTALIRGGSFRQDLFYRLNVIPIQLPPLRERTEDIQPVAERILAACARRLRRPAHLFDEEALEKLKTHLWPGNIRELENVIEMAVLMTRSEVVTAECLRLPTTSGTSCSGDPASRPETLHESERSHILRALEQCRWNKKRAAALLGINRSSLYNKLKRFGLLAAEEGAAGSCRSIGVQGADTQ